MIDKEPVPFVGWVQYSDDTVGLVGGVGGAVLNRGAGQPPLGTIKTDPVNSPSHYTVGGIETIDFIEAKGLEKDYYLGNAIKYISRANYKGKRLEDLKKAQYYLNRAIENEEKLK